MKYLESHMETPMSSPEDSNRRGASRLLVVGGLLFLATVALAVLWLGAEIRRARAQRKAVEAIRAGSGTVHYDSQYQFQSGYPRPLTLWREEPSDGRRLPHWLGRDFWHDVTYVGMETLLDGVPLLDFLYEPPSDAQAANERNGVHSHDTESVYTPPADVAHLSAFPRLQSLFLAGPTFDDDAVAHLTCFASVREVHLIRTSATDESIRVLRQAPQLENLYLDETPITDDGLASMNPNWPLRILDLSDTRVTDAGLGHVAQFEALEYLSLRGTRVTDASLSHLDGLQSLQQMDLSDTDVTHHGVQQLQDRLPQCNIRTSTGDFVPGDLELLGAEKTPD